MKLIQLGETINETYPTRIKQKKLLNQEDQFIKLIQLGEENDKNDTSKKKKIKLIQLEETINKTNLSKINNRRN